MKRVGEKGTGNFERISWDEAIAEITQRYQQISTQWGAEAILPYHYGGSNGLLGDSFLDFYYFAKLAFHVKKTLCAALGTIMRLRPACMAKCPALHLKIIHMLNLFCCGALN